jgi:hypothetical protein
MAAVVGLPSGHIGITMYAVNCSLALIFLAIFMANSMGIRFSAPMPAQERSNQWPYSEKCVKCFGVKEQRQICQMIENFFQPHVPVKPHIFMIFFRLLCLNKCTNSLLSEIK